MFYAAVVLFMVVLVLPSASAGIALADGGHGSTMEVVGTWFVFWAVGVRLFTAGVRQVVKPGLMSEGILGIPGRQAWLLVHELGSPASRPARSASCPVERRLAPCAALAGGLFLVAAGVLHAVKSHRDTEENVAMVSDLAIGGDARLRRLAMVRSEVHII